MLSKEYARTLNTRIKKAGTGFEGARPNSGWTRDIYTATQLTRPARTLAGRPVELHLICQFCEGWQRGRERRTAAELCAIGDDELFERVDGVIARLSSDTDVAPPYQIARCQASYQFSHS